MQKDFAVMVINAINYEEKDILLLRVVLGECIKDPVSFAPLLVDCVECVDCISNNAER